MTHGTASVIDNVAWEERPKNR